MRQAILGGMLAVIAIAPGCMEGWERGFYAAAEATPRYFEIKDLENSTALDAFKTVGVDPFDASPMLGTIPPAVVPDAQAAVVETLAETRMFDSVTCGAPVQGGLLIRGAFVDYDPGNSALRAADFGASPFLTARIEFIDTGGKKVVGMAMVSAVVKSAGRTGPKELAAGIAKAVRGLVEHHHSKPPEKAEPTPSGPGPAKKEASQ